MDNDDILPGALIARRNPGRLYTIVDVTLTRAYIRNEQSGFVTDVPLLDLAVYELVRPAVPDYPPDFATL